MRQYAIERACCLGNICPPRLLCGLNAAEVRPKPFNIAGLPYIGQPGFQVLGEGEAPIGHLGVLSSSDLLGDCIYPEQGCLRCFSDTYITWISGNCPACSIEGMIFQRIDPFRPCFLLSFKLVARRNWLSAPGDRRSWDKHLVSVECSCATIFAVPTA